MFIDTYNLRGHAKELLKILEHTACNINEKVNDDDLKVMGAFQMSSDGY